MARKLPWAASTITSHATSRTHPALPPTYSPARKRRKLSPAPADTKTEIVSPESRDDKSKISKIPDHDSTHANTRDHTRTRNHGRDPSTSPPPAPPDVRFMHEGIYADDGYMMVEDEFNEIAKTFTAHLHHAEYKRLMKEAQERKRLNVDVDATNGTMSRDTTVRQNVTRTLGLMNGDENKKSDEESDDESAREERRVADPWAGTTLAELMRYEPEKDRLNLKHAESMKSTARAALGFKSNNTLNHTTANTSTSTDEDIIPTSTAITRDTLPSLAQTIGKSKTSGPQHSASTTTNAHTRPSRHDVIPTSLHIPKPPSRIKVEAKTERTDRLIKSERDSIISTHIAIKQRPIRKFIDDLDDFDGPLIEEPTNQYRKTMITNTSIDTDTGKSKTAPRPGHVKNGYSPKIKKEKKDTENDPAAARKRMLDRLDEVPVFLA